ncbi:Bug family tripartite tricarboxylate transporter substrate binding protein [Muricoccus radiodurans]|uniref:Bug family tripartite tricarboxylate transporter substrate binding protein n=1 Tax=Muricoccus radiodurans TaxID=2231721 RepID=UPI003CF47228
MTNTTPQTGATKKGHTMLTRRHLLATPAALAVAGTASAQDANFPNRSLRMLVAYAPGGGTDLVARTLAQRLGTVLGQPCVVDNRPGAGGNIATDEAARSRPDGYTLLMGNQGPMAVNPSLFRNMRNDPATTLDPVALVADAPLLLVAGPKSRANTTQELLDEIKAANGNLTYGSASNGSASHLAAALMLQTANLEAVHVPFRGAGPALTDVVSGNLSFMITTLPSVMGLVQGGSLRAIATTGAQRSPTLPNVPTIGETLQGYTASAWYGIMVPKGTPEPIRAKLEAAIMESVTNPEVAVRLREDGAEPARMNGRDFGAYIARERTRWAEVIRRGAIQVD